MVEALVEGAYHNGGVGEVEYAIVEGEASWWLGAVVELELERVIWQLMRSKDSPIRNSHAPCVQPHPNQPHRRGELRDVGPDLEFVSRFDLEYPSTNFKPVPRDRSYFALRSKHPLYTHRATSLIPPTWSPELEPARMSAR